MKGVEGGQEGRGILEKFYFLYCGFICMFLSGMFGILNPIKILE